MTIIKLQSIRNYRKLSHLIFFLNCNISTLLMTANVPFNIVNFHIKRLKHAYI